MLFTCPPFSRSGAEVLSASVEGWGGLGSISFLDGDRPYTLSSEMTVFWRQVSPALSSSLAIQHTHTRIFTYAVSCLVVQSCPTLWDPIDSSLTGSSVCGDSPGKNIEVDCHALLQGTFSSQGSSQGLPPRKQILCCLSHQGSPYNYSRISWKGRS